MILLKPNEIKRADLRTAEEVPFYKMIVKGFEKENYM